MAVADDRRQLVDRRLAVARRHHGEGVAPVEDAANRLLLPRTEGREPELAPGHGCDVGARHLRRVPAGRRLKRYAAWSGWTGTASCWWPPFVTLRATSTARLSRMTVTFTWPGYSR